MKEILRLMIERESMLKKAIIKAELDEKSFPEGKLRISYSKNKPRYYKITRKGDKEGEYIIKEKRYEVSLLVQRFLNNWTKCLPAYPDSTCPKAST